MAFLLFISVFSRMLINIVCTTLVSLADSDVCIKTLTFRPPESIFVE